MTAMVANRVSSSEVDAAIRRAASALEAASWDPHCAHACTVAAYGIDAAQLRDAVIAYRISKNAFIDDAHVALDSDDSRHRVDDESMRSTTAMSADVGISSTNLALTPLWHDRGEPDWYPFPNATQRNLRDYNDEWSFWREWYQGFLDGNPMNWELQRRVALIDNAIWKAGPEAVAEEIERIRAHYALELEIAELKEKLRKSEVLQASAQRLHNQPPEAIENQAAAIRQEITLVWDELVELEAEIAKPKPSPSKLNKIAQALWDISVRIGKYCGSKVDLALDESAKVIGKTGTQVAIAYVTTTTAAQNEGIQSVVKAVWEFVKTLPPG